MKAGTGADPDTMTAFLFANNRGDRFGVSLDPHGANLPRGRGESWALQTRFDLGVQIPVPVRINPEPILAGIQARGYFV
jgi:hypothetical protein